MDKNHGMCGLVLLAFLGALASLAKSEFTCLNPVELQRGGDRKVLVATGRCGALVNQSDLRYPPEVILHNHGSMYAWNKIQYTLLFLEKHDRNNSSTLHWMLVNKVPENGVLTANKTIPAIYDYTPPNNIYTANYTIHIYRQNRILGNIRKPMSTEANNFIVEDWLETFQPGDLVEEARLELQVSGSANRSMLPPSTVHLSPTDLQGNYYNYSHPYPYNATNTSRPYYPPHQPIYPIHNQTYPNRTQPYPVPPHGNPSYPSNVPHYPSYHQPGKSGGNSNHVLVLSAILLPLSTMVLKLYL